MIERNEILAGMAGTATERPISIAIVAMGGQGGGVLTGWIVRLAEAAGWAAQSTSVPGVAQRTGATIYYVEMMPMAGGRRPILAQMPTPGDVDVVIASELMEAGRSILRGIVTPDRTTLIASSHRSLAIVEKIAPGEGIADSGTVIDVIGLIAKQRIVFDMDALAVRNGSVISSAMFGALAASGTVPFAKAAFHAVIEQDGKGVAASIKTFDAAFDQVMRGSEEPAAPVAVASPAQPAVDRRLSPLFARIDDLPMAARAMIEAGLRKVVDYQDAAYGREYLDLLATLHETDRALDGAAHGYALTVNAAKYLANAMTYDDVIRVADLKTRAGRRRRIEAEVGAKAEQVVHTTEFMHPRLEEVAGMLPAGFARWLQRRTVLYGWIDRKISKGRRVRTYALGWFLALYVMGGLRGLRRRSLRHADEVAHRDAWLARAVACARRNYDLGVEVLQCQRLIKGYSDTHARGLSKFDRVMTAIDGIEHRDDAAAWARRLREAAIRDAGDGQLDGIITTIASFT